MVKKFRHGETVAKPRFCSAAILDVGDFNLQ